MTALSPSDQVHHRHPGVTFAAVAAELAREAAARARTHPAMIIKGRMTETEAVHERAVLAAIAADLEAVRTLKPVPTSAPSWAERRGCLKRELALRERHYPEWIRSGRLDPAEAERRTAALKVMLQLYDDGRGWQASNGARCAWASLDPTLENRQARAEWAETSAALEAEGSDSQKEMAL